MFEKFKNSKITMRLFSLIIAVIIWLSITHTLNPVISQQVKFIPVTFTGEGILTSNGLVVLDKDDIGTVGVKVRGPRNSVIKAMSTITAKVNLSDITSVGEWTGDVTFDIGVSGVSIDGRATSKVTLTIDKLSEKDIPVIVKKTGSERERDKILSSVPEQDKVKIWGAKSEVSQVKALVIPVDASDVKEESTEEYEYYFVNNNNEKQAFSSVKTGFNTMSVENTFMNKKTVSLDVVLSKNDHVYYLEREWISSERIDVGVLEDFKDDKIEVLFNPDLYKEETEEYTLSVHAPKGVYVPYEYREIKAKLNLKELEKDEVTFDVEVKNAPKDYEYSLVKSSVTVSVKKIKGESIKDKVKGYVDLDGLSEGRHNIEIKIESDKPVFMTETKTVGVNIYKQKG